MDKIVCFCFEMSCVLNNAHIFFWNLKVDLKYEGKTAYLTFFPHPHISKLSNTELMQYQFVWQETVRGRRKTKLYYLKLMSTCLRLKWSFMIFYDYLGNSKSTLNQFFQKLKSIKFNELSPNFRIINKYSVFFPIISSRISLN